MKILRLPAVVDCTGLSRSTVYRLIRQKKFPKPFPLSDRLVGWLASEIEKWIESRTGQQAGER